MHILLLTSPGPRCGIAEYGEYLLAELRHAADVTVRPVTSVAEAESHLGWADLVHANAHSTAVAVRPEDVQAWQAAGRKVVVTQHDTFETWDLMRERGFPDFRGADALVVHEPIEGPRPPTTNYLIHYWRQGVHDWAPGLHFGLLPHTTHPDSFLAVLNCEPMPSVLVKADPRQPVVGTCGFPYAWKNWEWIEKGARLAGWAFWHPPGWMDYRSLLEYLSGCDATCFPTVTGGSGTSGAIRLGIAARKPVLASPPSACRMHRDLWLDPVGQASIRWLNDLTVEGIAEALSQVAPLPWDGPTVRLAAQDSWRALGARYADLYRRLLT